MKNNKITIINDHPVNKGLGRYAQVLFDTMNGSVEFNVSCLSLNLGFHSKIEDFPGKVLFSQCDYLISRKIPFNYKLPDISHFVRSRFINYFVRKSLNNDTKYYLSSIIHYANPGIYPFILTDRSVVTIHDLLFMRWHGIQHYMGDTNNGRYIRYYLNIPNVLTFTNSVKKEIEDMGFTGKVKVFFPPTSTLIHPLKTDKKKIRDKLGLPKNKILLLSVSTNRPGKNLKALREMMQLMDDRYRLVRVGEPVGDSITFKGVSDETLNEIYNACDVLVFPSTEEGFGIPVTEAFKVGLPVVASDIEVMREVCGNAAILVDPEPLKYLNAVKEALSNSETIAVKGKTRSKLFSIARFRDNMNNFYRGI